jgi:hypothetical protein
VLPVEYECVGDEEGERTAAQTSESSWGCRGEIQSEEEKEDTRVAVAAVANSILEEVGLSSGLDRNTGVGVFISLNLV